MVRCFKLHMACILRTDMDPATASATTLNTLLPAPGLDHKQDPNATCLTVHLYHQAKDGGECRAKGADSVLTFPAGEYVAEELCISAAKACGELHEDFCCDICPQTFRHISWWFLWNFSSCEALVCGEERCQTASQSDILLFNIRKYYTQVEIKFCCIEHIVTLLMMTNRWWCWRRKATGLEYALNYKIKFALSSAVFLWCSVSHRWLQAKET